MVRRSSADFGNQCQSRKVEANGSTPYFQTRFEQWLLGEMEAWRAGGILADDQPGRILDLYETSLEAAGRRRSLAMFALSSVAALMIGLAALLVVSYNWQALSAAQKLAIIFGALLGLHGAGFALRYGGRWRLSSEIVFFVACMLYGSAIWLIAQIFHIQSHYPDGLWFWAVGVLPFALCLDTLLMHALYAGLLALWVGTEILGFHDAGFWGSMFLRGCAATLPLLALPGLLWAYRKRSAATVGSVRAAAGLVGRVAAGGLAMGRRSRLFRRPGRRDIPVDCRDAPRGQPDGEAVPALRSADHRRRAGAAEFCRLYHRFAPPQPEPSITTSPDW